MKYIFIIIFLFSIQFVFSQVYRGEILTEKDEEQVIGNYHALLFSVENYNDEKIPDLSGPLSDVKRFEGLLSDKYGFASNQISVIADPSRSDILEALVEKRKTLKKEDNLIVFFGGHGLWNQDSLMGYWLPSDYQSGDLATGVANSELKKILEDIKSKHILLISDACYSGSIFKGRSLNDLDGFKKQLFLNKSRKAMTSGMLQRVPEKSVFMDKLMTYLEKNPSKYLLAQELFYSIQRDVAHNQMSANQKSIVPLYAPITGCDDQNGEFIFYNETGGLDDVTAISFTKPSFQRFAQQSMTKSVSLGKIFQFPETPLEYLGNARVYNVMGMVNESVRAYLNYFSLSMNELYIDPHFEMISIIDETDEALKKHYVDFLSEQEQDVCQFFKLKMLSGASDNYGILLADFIQNNPDCSIARIDYLKYLYREAVKNGWQPMIKQCMMLNKAAADFKQHIKNAKKYFLRTSDFDDYLSADEIDAIQKAAFEQIPSTLKFMLDGDGIDKHNLLEMANAMFLYGRKTMSDEEKKYIAEIANEILGEAYYDLDNKQSFAQFGVYCLFHNKFFLDTNSTVDVNPNGATIRSGSINQPFNCTIDSISNSKNLSLVFDQMGTKTAFNYSVTPSALTGNDGHTYLRYFKEFGGLSSRFKSTDVNTSQSSVSIVKNKIIIKESAESMIFPVRRYGNGLFVRMENDLGYTKEYSWIKLFDIESDNDIQMTDPSTGKVMKYTSN